MSAVTSELAEISGGVLTGVSAVAAIDDSKSAAHLWLRCKTGSHHFALPMPSVIEIMRMLPVESIAGAPSLVRGLSIIRGTPVAVIDTARLFGGESARYERLVAVRTGDRIVAFAADAVLAVESIDASVLEQLPPLLRDDNEDDPISAIATRDQNLVFFLRAARAIPDDFFSRDGVDRVVS
jgi:purine-binding chemotaxis protein CheW